ncbi:MAG: type II toxin-antitoxin system RelE family toxin [Ignavibacteria bacterium]
MKVEFLSKFNKDLDKIKSDNIKNSILKVIQSVENVNSLSDIKNIKKLTGFRNAYRIRIGNYRIGLYYENNILEFVRILHRKDIYKVFPHT